MHVVTSGYRFIDIDAYASAVALAELLRLQGTKAVAASSAPFNASIPQFLKTLPVHFVKNYRSTKSDIFSLVDISDPEYFDFHIRPEQITQIIDHHQGFKTFWQDRLGPNAHIEHLGAACTQIYELWRDANLFNKMSKESAQLLACGILDNTLNLQAHITTKRDKTAYSQLLKQAGLSRGLAATYFGECQVYIAENIEEALRNDTKPLDYPSLTHTTIVGQLALWDTRDFLANAGSTIRSFLGTKNLPWYMNLIDIKANKSVFICEDTALQQWLGTTLDITFDKDMAIAERMWLRKEIMQQAINKEETHVSD